MAYQHIRIKNSNVAGKVPTSGQIDVAELCVNLKDHKLFSKDTDGNIFELGGGGAQVPGGGTPPVSGNEIGDLFFDTVNQQLLYWDGTAWVPIAGDEVQNLEDLKDVIITDPEAGDALVWNGTNWVNTDLNSAVLNPSPTPPTGTPELGDIWVDTSQCPPVLNIWSDCEDPGNPEWTPIGGGALQPIFPEPDEIASNPGFQGGTGTQADPFLLQPITVRPAGASGNSTELIKINVVGAQGGQPVEFTDLSTGAGDRFRQPTGMTAADGTWTGRFSYTDAPNTAADTSYTGDLQIGNVYFRWVVTQGVDAVRPIDPSPDEITASPNFLNGDGTQANPYILAPITVAPAGSGGQTVETLTIAEAGAAAGETVTWVNNSVGSGVRFDQPAGVTGVGGTWSGRLVYNDNPDTQSDQDYVGDLLIGSVYFRWTVTQNVVDASIEQPEVLTPPDGAGIGGDAVINTVDATKEAPGADSIVFTSSIPVVTSGSITTWGNAEWQIATDSSYTTDLQTTSVPITAANAIQQVPAGTFTLADDAEYYVRVRYTSTDPAFASDFSNSAHRFKTAAAVGDGWFSATPPENNDWRGVTYGDGKFVAVSGDGTHRVMYSSNGINWTEASAAEANSWQAVTYGNGKFVAVANTGTNRVMYSTNGINWNTASAAAASNWYDVTYGNGKFVAVANGAGTLVMYSTDGETWIAGNAAEITNWNSVTYGDGKFVAVASAGTNRVMYSTDGQTWTGVSVPGPSGWRTVTYGDGKFVAVASAGSNNNARAMYSTNGINWTGVSVPQTNTWYGVTYGGGKFVAVAIDGVNRVMHSTNGINWTIASAAENSGWIDVIYGGDKFVAVAVTGTNRVMYSFTGVDAAAARTLYDENTQQPLNDVQLSRRYGINADTANLSQLNIAELTEEPDGPTLAYVPAAGGKYQPIPDQSETIAEQEATISELRERVTTLTSRVSGIEADELVDDAVDATLLTTIGSLLDRVQALEDA